MSRVVPPATPFIVFPLDIRTALRPPLTPKAAPQRITAGHSRSKNGVASLSPCPTIHGLDPIHVSRRVDARHDDSIEPHPTLTVAGTRGSGAPMVLEKEMLRKNETDALEMEAASRENE
jgi:hypothetical protein